MGQKIKDFMIKNTNILHASFKALNFAFRFNGANSKNLKDFMVNKWFQITHLFLRACYDFDAFFCIYKQSPNFVNFTGILCKFRNNSKLDQLENSFVTFFFISCMLK